MGTDAEAGDPVVLAVHGGAGTLGRDRSATAERSRRAGLRTGLRAGRDVLDGGGASEDAVVEAVAALEDTPGFNAGRGAVYTSDATQELEAAVMGGAARNAGAVAGLTHVRNPVRLARVVLDRSTHVLLVGRGAEVFAAEHGLDLVEARYFHSEAGLRALLRESDREDAGGAATPGDQAGTVGAVALDDRGRLAAATSTGGVTGKAPGRVGDSPLIGAGTYADGQVAVSTTGQGEYFLRTVAAHEVAALVGHAGLTVAEAGQRVLADVGSLGGEGGLIALDRAGRLTTPFATEAMPRGWAARTGETTVLGEASS